jgi:murein DD-endopeptidase MepM/ murein hydrolase activator NlpD
MKKPRPNKKQLKDQDSLLGGVKSRWSKFWNKGKEPLTVMIAPHSEAKVMHFRVSLLFLWFVIIIAIGLVAGVIVFSTGFQKQVKINSAQKIENDAATASLGRIHNELATLEHITPALEQALTTATREMDGNRDITMNDVSGDIKNQLQTPSTTDISNADVNTIRRIRSIIESSLPQIKTIRDTLDSQKALLAEMPTKWPLGNGLSGHISQLFGPSRDPFTGEWQWHTGTDIALGYGVPVVAAANGTVVKREFNAGGYGLYIVIRHSYGFSTLYGHMQRYSVNVGDVVKQGDVIGLMGSTGRSTGPHVHFEVMIGTEKVDPMRYLAINNQAYSRYIRQNEGGRGYN